MQQCACMLLPRAWLGDQDGGCSYQADIPEGLACVGCGGLPAPAVHAGVVGTPCVLVEHRLSHPVSHLSVSHQKLVLVLAGRAQRNQQMS